MNRFIRVSATLVAFAVSATLAFAHEYKLGNIEIKHPWSKATVVGAPVGGGYLSIANTGTEPDRLMMVTSDVSKMTQIHEMKVEDGVMKMGEIRGGLEIAPGAIVDLKPGGLHVMFIGIKAPFKQGESVKAVLTFDKAGTIEVEFKIDAAKKGADADKHHQTQ